MFGEAFGWKLEERGFFSETSLSLYQRAKHFLFAPADRAAFFKRLQKLSANSLLGRCLVVACFF